MIKDIVAIKLINLLAFSLLTYLGSFAIPTGVSLLILSFSAITMDLKESVIIFIIAFLSCVLGDISAYFFSRLFSAKAIQIVESRKSLKISYGKAHGFFMTYGFYAVFFSRFLLSALGPIVNYYCGLTQYSFKKFTVATVFGELLYSCIYVSLGIMFKDFIAEILNLFNGLLLVTILLIAMAVTLQKIKEQIIVMGWYR